MMEQLFERTKALWIRYTDYEWKEASDGTLYLTAAADARPQITDPMKEYDHIVVDAVNIGRMSMGKSSGRYSQQEIQDAILTFAQQYGLLGLMTALPTTPKFMDYESVYLPKNHFINDESLTTQDYLKLFFPFGMPDLTKAGAESSWSIEGDIDMMALAMTMSDRPIAVNMSFQREYAERLEWLEQQFTDWAFTLTSCFFYYEDYDNLSVETRLLYQQAMSAFDGIAPTYRIELHDKPVIVWDFHSLLLGVQMMFSFLLTDDRNPLRMCRHCGKAFIASRPSAVFCSPRCKNQYNVYKSRKKKENDSL